MNFSQPELDIKNNYNKENIEDSLLLSELNLRQTQEFIDLCKLQLEKIKKTKFQKEVHVVYLVLADFEFYFVGCYLCPEIETVDDVTVTAPTLDLKRFNGAEKLEAMWYAEKLAKKHKCEIKIIGDEDDSERGW